MSLQSMMTRFIFALPSGVLRAMAGPPVEVDGKTLDPRIAMMAAQASKNPGLETFPVPVAREAMRMGLALVDAKPRSTVATRDLFVPGGDGSDLPARAYSPKGPSYGRPLIVYFHQGGCVIGGLWTCDAWCSQLAEETGASVLNVEYRKAPEHKFPAAVDDALSAYRWAVANARALGASPDRVAVGGDSAGGYLSAVICHDLKRAGEKQPVLQLLIYPAVDWTAAEGTMQSMASAYPLTRSMMDWFAGHYLNDEHERVDPRVSPALAADQSGLAPAFIYNAGFDPLTSQGKAYADKLSAAGVKVTYRCYDSLSHSFTAMSGVVPAARAALTEIAAEVKAGLA